MSNVNHHRVFPTNTNSQYTQLNNIDFELSFPMRKMIANSVRLEGKVRFNQTGNVQVGRNDEVSYDFMIGANALFQDIQTQSTNQGNIELITELPRYTKMVATAMSSEDDMSNISNLCELKCQNYTVSTDVMRGNANGQLAIADPNVNGPISFSVKPIFALNQVSNPSGGDVHVRHATTGDIRISVRLARDVAVIWGATTGANYAVSDLSLTFLSVEDDGKQSPLTVRTKLNISQSIQSSFANVSVNVPSLSNGVSCSFLRQDKENTYDYNNTELDRPPNVNNIEFLFNDQTNKYVTFKLDTQEQFIDSYLLSIRNQNEGNTFSLSNIRANTAYGQGINFNQLLDLSKNRFGINLSSAISNIQPYLIYMYFHGFVTLA